MLNARRLLRIAAPLLALLLAVDILFSLFSTCDQISNYPHQNYSSEKHCTALGGPLIGNVWRFLVWFGHVLHEYDKEIVALFTAILTLCTIALWWSTRKLWRAGEEQIKVAMKAANAADRSARAAIALQLPIMRIHPDKLGHGETSIGGQELEECFVPGVVIANLGPTKAFPLEILYGWTIGNELPPEPSYRFIDSFSTNVIFEPDTKITPANVSRWPCPWSPDNGRKS